MFTHKKPLSSITAPIIVTPREAVLGCIACGCAAAACLMTGMVAGMLISPRKAVTIGSNNGGNVVDKRSFPCPDSESDSESDTIAF